MVPFCWPSHIIIFMNHYIFDHCILDTILYGHNTFSVYTCDNFSAKTNEKEKQFFCTKVFFVDKLSHSYTILCDITTLNVQ